MSYTLGTYFLVSIVQWYFRSMNAIFYFIPPWLNNAFLIANWELCRSLLHSPGKLKTSILRSVDSSGRRGGVEWRVQIQGRGGLEVPTVPAHQGREPACPPHQPLASLFASLSHFTVHTQICAGCRLVLFQPIPWHQVCILLKDNLQIKTETCNKFPLQLWGCEASDSLRLDWWSTSRSSDDAQQTLQQRGTAAQVGSGKGEGNTAIKTKRIMILKGIIVVTMPLTFFFKPLGVWSLLEV